MADDTTEGVEDRISRIYADTIDPLHASVSGRCGGDGDLADDIVQETWLRAVREWRKQGLPARPAAWLTTVSRNLLFNEFRGRRLVGLDDLDPDEILAEDFADLADAAEVESAVRQALERLPRHESQLLEAFHLERTPVLQIAASMGISGRAVEGRLRRARVRLRRELESSPAADSSRVGGRFSVLPFGIGSGSHLPTFLRSLMTIALLPLLLVIAIFPLSLLTQRLPRRTLGYARVAGGIGMILLAAAAAPDARALPAVGVAMALWGIWMLHSTRTGDRAA